MNILKIVIIGLKITEFVSLVIAMANAGHFLKESRDNEDSSPSPYDLGYYGRLEFFLFTTSVGMMIVMVGFSLFITGLVKKINAAQAMITIHGSWTFLLLVSSALVAKSLNTLDSKFGGRDSICDILDENDADYQCSHLIAAVVFGFVAMFLFLLDSGIYIFTSITTQESQSKQSANGNSQVPGSNVEAKTNPAIVHT